MKIREDIRPVTYLKGRAADLLKQINETHRPVIITQNGVPQAVLQDPESYQRMCDAIALLKLLAHSEQAARDGKVLPQARVFGSLRKRLAQRGKSGAG